MKRIFFSTVAAIALMSTGAIAGGNKNSNAKATSQSNAVGVGVGVGIGVGGAGGAGGNASVQNANMNRNMQGQLQGQMQGQSGFGSGNATNVTLRSSNRVDAEPAYAPDIALTSSNCIGSWGASGGGGGIISIGGGGTIEVENCFKLEAAKILLSLGQTANAIRLIHSVPYIGNAINPPAPAQTNTVASGNSTGTSGQVSGRFAAKDTVWESEWFRMSIPVTYDYK